MRSEKLGPFLVGSLSIQEYCDAKLKSNVAGIRQEYGALYGVVTRVSEPPAKHTRPGSERDRAFDSLVSTAQCCSSAQRVSHRGSGEGLRG
jgi:hypothetical protein